MAKKARATKKAVTELPGGKKKIRAPKAKASKKKAAPAQLVLPPAPPPAPQPNGTSPAVLDRLWGVVASRRDADPQVSHSARLMARGTAKIAQKFGEEAVECLIEAVSGNRAALIAESADVLYHLIVMWVDAGVRTDEVWAELERREGISGVAEKASRAQRIAIRQWLRTRKIP
jgi:phosphoribosyl-ATP pyrophosphohydrolase